MVYVRSFCRFGQMVQNEWILSITETGSRSKTLRRAKAVVGLAGEIAVATLDSEVGGGGKEASVDDMIAATVSPR